MHAIDAHSVAHSREGVLTLLLDAGAAVDVWGHDLTGPLDLLARREQEVQQQAKLNQQQAQSLPSPSAAMGARGGYAPSAHIGPRGSPHQTHPDLGVLIRQKSQRMSHEWS